MEEVIKSEIYQSTEMVEMWSNTTQDERYQTLEMENLNISLNRTENTNHKKITTKQSVDRVSKNPSIAAAQLKEALEGEKNQEGRNPHTVGLNTSPSEKKVKSGDKESNIDKEGKFGKVDYIINVKWRALIPVLDAAGIPINKTLKDLLKLYSAEKVESALKD